MDFFYLKNQTYWLEFKLGSGAINGGFGFPRIQTCVQIMFSGVAFSNDNYFSTLATYHPPYFMSDL